MISTLPSLFNQTSKAKKLGFFTQPDHNEKGEDRDNSGGEFEDESDSDEVEYIIKS
jgi:hypothetical protein